MMMTMMTMVMTMTMMMTMMFIFQSSPSDLWRQFNRWFPHWTINLAKSSLFYGGLDIILRITKLSRKKGTQNKHNVVKMKSCIGSCVMMMRNTERDDVTAFSVPRRELPNYWPGIFWEHSRGMIPVPISVIASRRRSSSYNGNRKQDLPIMAIGNKIFQ